MKLTDKMQSCLTRTLALSEIPKFLYCDLTGCQSRSARLDEIQCINAKTSQLQFPINNSSCMSCPFCKEEYSVFDVAKRLLAEIALYYNSSKNDWYSSRLYSFTKSFVFNILRRVYNYCYLSLTETEFYNACDSITDWKDLIDILNLIVAVGELK